MPTATLPPPGRRIAVVGTSGCGKTYVAQALAVKLGVPYVSNDAIIWRPGWQETPREERVVAVDAATRGEGWTFDGNISAHHPDDQIVLKRCDTIVWLDLPRWQVWSQIGRRTLRRVIRREELWHGNRESVRMMLSRESVVLHSITSFDRRRRAYSVLFASPEYRDRTLIRLRSRGEVDAWLASVVSSAVS